MVVICNFSVANLDIVPDFPYTGTWYDLMDETGATTLNVTNTASPINIPAGEFRIFGNAASTLSIPEQVLADKLIIYPNPTSNSFSINKPTNRIEIYDTTGKLVYNFNGRFIRNHAFDISNLEQGMYIVKVHINNNAIAKQLIVN